MKFRDFPDFKDTLNSPDTIYIQAKSLLKIFSLVPVDIWTSTTLPPPLLEADKDGETTALDNLPMSTNPGGCDIDGEFFMDGMKIPTDPANPCDLCYCIKNNTACVMQECTLKVEGCEPVYVEGVCCPVKYICGKICCKKNIS